MKTPVKFDYAENLIVVSFQTWLKNIVLIQLILILVLHNAYHLKRCKNSVWRSFWFTSVRLDFLSPEKIDTLCATFFVVWKHSEGLFSFWGIIFKNKNIGGDRGKLIKRECSQHNILIGGKQNRIWTWWYKLAEFIKLPHGCVNKRRRGLYLQQNSDGMEASRSGNNLILFHPSIYIIIGTLEI